MNASRLIDDIRGLLVQPDMQDLDLLSEVLYEYSEAVAACNERLRSVMALVDKGHHAEAIDAADHEPPLLELVGQLEFPERELFVAMVADAGLAPPASLRLDLAERLDGVYATTLGLEALLKKQRLLALCRSSLASRIAIQRLLCQRDDSNLIWKQDLQALERARLKEIEGAFSAACRQQNESLIQSIYAELVSPGWSIGIPRELVSRVLQVSFDITEKQQRAALQELGGQLREAFMTYNASHGGPLLLRLRSAAESLGAEKAKPLLQEFSDAIAWAEGLESEQENEAAFARAVQQLSFALDRRCSLAELDRVEYRLREFGYPLSPALATRLQTYRKSLEFRGRSRVSAIAASVIIATAAVVFGVWRTMDRYQQAAEIASHTQRLEQLLQDNELAAASSLLSSLPTSISEAPSIRALAARLENDASVEEKRVADRRVALDAARRAGLENPDLASLQMASDLSVSDTEKTEVAQLRLDVERRQNELKSEREAAFRVELMRFTSLVAEASKRPPTAATMKLLQDLRSEIENWHRESAGMIHGVEKIAESERRRVDPLFRSIETASRQIEQELSLSQAAQLIDGKVGDTEGYLQQLNGFVAGFGDTLVAADVSQAMQEKEFWDAWMSQSRFVEDPRWASFPELEAAAAGRFVTEGKAILEAGVVVPITTELRNATESMERVSRLADFRLADLFDRRLFQGLQLLVDDKGRQFYLTRVPEDKGQELEISYYLDSDFLVGKERIPKTKATVFPLAPQCVLFESIKPELDRFGEEGLDVRVAILEVLSQVLEFKYVPPSETAGSTPLIELDPVLRLKIVSALVARGLEFNDPALNGLLQPIQEDLEAAQETLEIDWLDPRSPVGTSARQEASEFIEKLPPVATFRRAASQLTKSGASSSLPQITHRWIGWVWRRSDGGFELRAAGAVPADTKLFLLVPSATEKQPTATFVAISRTKDNELDPASNVLLAGRPVFAQIAP